MLEGKLIIIPALGPQPVKLDRPLFECPSEGIIMSLPSSMADFASSHRLLQKAYKLRPTKFSRSISLSLFALLGKKLIFVTLSGLLLEYTL